MSGAVDTERLPGLLARLHATLDDIQAAAPTSCSQDELIAVLHEMERSRRRLDAAEYPVINDLAARAIPAEAGCRSAGQYLRTVLKLAPGDANVRAAAAEASTAFTHVAEAQASGSVSQRAALVIEKAVDELPDDVAAEHGDEIERELVGYAEQFEPRQLSSLARRLVFLYDQDGVLSESEKAERRRSLVISTRPDGSSHVEGELTAECTERLLSALDVTAAPKPAADGTLDSRSAAQRNHDGLLALLDVAVRAEELESVNGIAGTVVVTMTSEQYLTGEGLARTSHGGLVPVGDALRWLGGDAEVFAIAVNSMKAITHHGNVHRIYSRNQRLAIAARDKGCTFPGCSAPPGRCQINHVQRFEHGGRTSIDNGALVCGYHHRDHEKHGWTNIMRDGIPYWVPPTSIDPQQTPVRNTLHDTAPAA